MATPADSCAASDTNHSTKRAKILHVHTLPVVSGSGINTLLTMKGSRERGHEVSLACASEGRLTEETRRAGITVHLVKYLDRELNAAADFASVLELRRLMVRGKFDLVHTHNSKAGFVGRLAAHLARVPLIVHTVHGFAFHDQETRFRRALFRTVEQLASRWCDGMIFVSTPMVAWAERQRIGTRVPRKVIFSGVPADEFQLADKSTFRRQWSLAPDRLVVGIISKLWEGKGHVILLDAWKQALATINLDTEPLLLIVGEGPLEEELRKRVSSLRIDSSVLFTGFQSDVPSAMAGIDIAVLPSLFEGMGRAVLEAMAAGKPVIASNVGGIPDLVRHGENGLLVRPGDGASLTKALAELLSNAELRNRLGRNGAAGFRPEYRSSHMIEEIHQFYEELRERRTIRQAGSFAGIR
jgi:glycosyltransferase involved in cell wall biosynthesis